MGRPSLLSDPMPCWTEDNRGSRGGGGQCGPPLGSRHRRGVGNSNPMLALLMWMSFMSMAPLTMGAILERLNRHHVYLEDAVIPS